MSKRKKILIVSQSILIALTLWFIFKNSILSKQQSSEQSGSVFFAFQYIFDAIFGAGVITPSVFRKMAHAIEFALLGFQVYLLYYTLMGFKIKRLFEVLCLGLIVGIIDESIQILSNRGAQVSDVWIDFGGYALGVGVSMLSMFIVNFIIKKRRAKKKLSSKEE